MITPVNGHILIEPVAHDSFVASAKETYEEVGIVTAVSGTITEIKAGDKVFFDSWLAARYPKNENEYFWLVRWDDVRAVEYAE